MEKIYPPLNNCLQKMKRYLILSLCLFTQLAYANFPDLKLDNVQINAPIIAGTSTTYTIDLVNGGAADATGLINISVYLSEDRQWSQTDILLNAFVEPGSSGTKTLSGELTIPDLRGGKFHLIFLVDQPEIFIESNELNNQLLHPIEIIGQEGAVPCSFIKPFSNNFYVDAPPTVVEQSDGYKIRVPLNSFNSSDFLSGELSADVYGNSLSFDSIMVPKPTEPDYEIVYQFGSPEFYFQFFSPTGDTIFNAPILLNGNHELSGMIESFIKVIPFNDGYLLVGTYEYLVGTNGRSYELFLITTDGAGNMLTENYNDNITGYHYVQEILTGADGSIYLWTEHWADFDHIFKINPDGSLGFHTGAVAGSTGSWLQELRLSPTGDYLWGRIGSNSRDEILRVDTQSGAVAIEDSQNILSPDSPPGDDFYTGFSFDQDGNILLGQQFYEWANDAFIGYEIGLMSPDFELIWEHRIAQPGNYPRIYPLGEVSTGYLFLANRANTEGAYLMKVAADGTLTEDCEDEEISSGPLGCDLNYTFVNNQLILGGDGMNAAHVKIKVFDGNYNFLKRCLDCGNTIDLPNFNGGALIIDILLLDEGWNPLCESFETIDVTNSGCTDLDNDGVCAEQDCDDQNPLVPVAAGTSCDDGNLATQNDVIQADGCTCAGMPVSTECDFTVSTANGMITITGLTEADRAKIFTADYDTFWKCNPWSGNLCSGLETITDLTVGATYYVSIKSDLGGCEEWIEVMVTDVTNNDLADLTGSNVGFSGATTLVAGDVLNFEFDAANIGVATTGSFTIKSYISTDPSLDASDFQDGIIPTGNWAPGYAVSNLAGALTVPNLPAGNYFLIVYLDADEEVNEQLENNNLIISTTTFTILGEETNCVTDLAGFSYMGSYNQNNYFISEDASSWPDAKAVADNIPDAYLATINDADENEFIRAYIEQFSEKVFIGYRDLNSDGTYEWDNGAAVTYSNPSGTLDEPYTHLQYWDGKWSSDGDFKFRNFIVEIPCMSNNASATQYESKAKLINDAYTIGTLFPNPVATQLTTMISTDSAMNIQINCYDQLGKKWSRGTFQLNKGSQQLEIPVIDLPKGIFFLEIINQDGFRSTRRFVKL